VELTQRAGTRDPAVAEVATDAADQAMQTA